MAVIPQKKAFLAPISLATGFWLLIPCIVMPMVAYFASPGYNSGFVYSCSASSYEWGTEAYDEENRIAGVVMGTKRNSCSISMKNVTLLACSYQGDDTKCTKSLSYGLNEYADEICNYYGKETDLCDAYRELSLAHRRADTHSRGGGVSLGILLFTYCCRFIPLLGQKLRTFYAFLIINDLSIMTYCTSAFVTALRYRELVSDALVDRLGPHFGTGSYYDVLYASFAIGLIFVLVDVFVII
eukprot:TRINITY_DN8806_c0_g1_i2.p1 TRINITY_DN8806_c0_g1~~TRINITY_DN8806_c0_g1_i2.p1  ORF type:complete len:241 (+),score=27.86 TRINITY_DN8806_c0_g1_i2:99-821(+)